MPKPDYTAEIPDVLRKIREILDSMHPGETPEEKAIRIGWAIGMLPVPIGTHANWRRVLGFGDFYAPERNKVLARFKKLARKRHPDMGGSHELFIELIEARDAALQECRI